MNYIIFITGGARSGKSFFAEEFSRVLAKANRNKQIAYLATSEIIDKEMKNRISNHKKRRGENFTTYEVAIKIDETAALIYNDHNIIIVECLATWLGNIMHKKKRDAEKISFSVLNDFLLKFKELKNKSNEDLFWENIYNSEKRKFKIKLSTILKKRNSDKFLIIVSNEVNLGIVPDNKLSRDYRDLLGKLNQTAAANSDFVYFFISGQAMRLK